MFRIRDELLEHFADRGRERVEQQIASRLTRAFPEVRTLWRPEAARAYVHTIVDRGLQLGLRSPGALFEFAALRTRLGEGFPDAPQFEWALGLLSDEQHPPEVRVRLVSRRLEDPPPRPSGRPR